MTNEEKQLLLKDICARLPHKQKVCYKIHDNSEEITETLSGLLLDYFKTGKISVVKPYLRPMSSMTEEEDKDWQFYKGRVAESCDELLGERIKELHDWLNAHHFDYRGLIPMGLAIEAPKDMYKN